MVELTWTEAVPVLAVVTVAGIVEVVVAARLAASQDQFQIQVSHLADDYVVIHRVSFPPNRDHRQDRLLVVGFVGPAEAFHRLNVET